MKVHELGEFGLIKLLAEIIDECGAGFRSSPTIIEAIGDDAAVWKCYDSIQLATTDMLVQDIHFTLETTSWRDLGWKSLAVNISDIAAMGGIPSYAMISLGLPANTEVEQISELYRGMAEIAHQFGMCIAGGDTTEAPMLVICPSVIGEASKDSVLTRLTAVPGDLIAVTGYLGAAAAGLRMMEKKLEFDAEIVSALSGAQLRPSPRIAEGQILAKHGVRTAIDISDGLIADLNHICEMSKVGARVHLQNIPIHPAVKTAFGEDALKLALTGGEDYELLFTAPERLIEKVKGFLTAPVTVIGEVAKGGPHEVALIDEYSKRIEWEVGGWEHFAKSH